MSSRVRRKAARSSGVVDLFAGAGGWDLGAETLGLSPLGVEIDDAACWTRSVAGLRTFRDDVSALDPSAFAPCGLLIASPPCPSFSTAGDQHGNLLFDLIVSCARELSAGRDRRREFAKATEKALLAYGVAPEKATRAASLTMLVVEPLRWAFDLLPDRVAFEQVPPVLPLWMMFAPLLEERGYKVWYGILNAADYGVPQTRRRAFLLASRVGRALPPEPTHCRGGALSLGTELLPWVSMAEALGWGMTVRPAVTVAAGSSRQGGHDPLDGGSGPRATVEGEKTAGRWKQRSGQSVNGEGRAERDSGEPSVVIHGRADLNTWVPDDVTLEERRVHGARGGPHEPAPTICGAHDNGNLRWIVNTRGERDETTGGNEFPADEPSWAVTGRARSRTAHARQETLPILHTNRGQDEDGARQEVDGGRRAPTVSGKSGGQWVFERPATSVCGDARVSAPGYRGRPEDYEDDGTYIGERSMQHAVRITIEEAAILQGFPRDYPWKGTRTKQFEQVGNAVPPPLARAILEELLR